MNLLGKMMFDRWRGLVHSQLILDNDKGELMDYWYDVMRIAQQSKLQKSIID